MRVFPVWSTSQRQHWYGSYRLVRRYTGILRTYNQNGQSYVPSVWQPNSWRDTASGNGIPNVVYRPATILWARITSRFHSGGHIRKPNAGIRVCCSIAS